jgi:hypothetical protein
MSDEDIKKELEKIIEDDKNAIINPYASNKHSLVTKLAEKYGNSTLSRIIDKESLLYDCYSIGKKKEGENVGKKGIGWDERLQRWEDEKPEIVTGHAYQKAPDKCKNKALKCWWKGMDDKNTQTNNNEKLCGLIGKHLRKKKVEIKEEDILRASNMYNNERRSPDTVTAVNTPTTFNGGRKKTRKKRGRRKKKTRRRRKKTKRKKKKKRKKSKRKKSKRKKRSRKLRGGNYWEYDSKKNQYKCYITVNHKGSKKHLFGKIATFNSLPEFTKHMCKWYNKKILGLIQHPKVFNEDPDLKETYNKATQKYEYKYICGKCKKIIKYKKDAFDGFHPVSDDVEERWVVDAKKKDNLQRFEATVSTNKKASEKNKKNDVKRKDSAPARFFEPEEEGEEVWVPYIPSDDEW